MHINTNSIKQSANNMQDNIDSLQLQLSKLINLVDKVSDAWRSDAGTSKEFVMDMKESYILNFQNLINNLDSLKEFLKNVPSAYQTFDNSYANKDLNV